ncbi:MAG: glycosyl transferase family 36, partial [Clostridia bacterium]
YIDITLTNNRNTVAKLDVTGYFEWAPGLAYDNHREFQKLFSTLSYDKDSNAILLKKCLWGFPDNRGIYNNDNWPYTAFFSCSREVDSFDCDKEKFLGMYREEACPIGMEKRHLSGSDGRYGDPVGCLRTKEIVIEPNSEIRIVFCIGSAKDKEEEYKDLISKTTIASADEELSAVADKWQKLIFDNEQVETPDESFNIMTNIWCKYQALSGRMWAKAGYYQISGGIGYRDQLQDSLIMLENNPKYTKKQILLHAAHQFQAGDVQHWWLQIGTVGPRTKCSDDFLWLVFVTIEYIRETGDYSILDEKVSFVDGGDSATMFEHCRRAINLSFSRFSPRGIPLMGDHDWNDGLSAVGNAMKGESFWVAEFLYKILIDFAPISRRINREFSEEMSARAKKLKIDFNKYAWDGEWFLQATNDLGNKIGSKECKEGKIFLNPQIWAVMSGITDKERERIAMESVTKYLLKDYGALLLVPAYETPNENIGYITRYAPGLRENGGVYTHAATWAVWAYALMGDKERAYKAYSSICPPNRSKDIDRFVSEPYVLCGNSDGPVSPNYGRGGWSWYTGSAQWLHNVAIKWILGIRPTDEGLLISPSIPDEWNGYKCKRTYKGAVYNITVINHASENSISLDGTLISGNVLPQIKGAHNVVVNIK